MMVPPLSERPVTEEDEFLGKASAFFPFRHQNTSGLN